MAVRRPQDVLADIAVSATPTPIAGPATVSGGFIVDPNIQTDIAIPETYKGYGFRGRLTAKTAAVTIHGTTPVTTDGLTTGTVVLAAGETTGFLDGVDLARILVSGSGGAVLHVCGVH